MKKHYRRDTIITMCASYGWRCKLSERIPQVYTDRWSISIDIITRQGLSSKEPARLIAQLNNGCA